MSAPAATSPHDAWKKAGYIALGLASIPVGIWLRKAAPSLWALITTAFLLVVVFAGPLWSRRSQMISFANGPTQARRRRLLLAMASIDVACIVVVGLGAKFGTAAFLPAIVGIALTRPILQALGPRYRTWLAARSEDLDDYHRIERHRARDYAMSAIAAAALGMILIGVGLASVVRAIPGPYLLAQLCLGFIAAWSHLPIAILAWRDPDPDLEDDEGDGPVCHTRPPLSLVTLVTGRTGRD